MNRKDFTPKQITEVFRKSSKISSDANSNQFRKDRDGRKICRSSYGHEGSKYGWNVHHKNGNPKDNSMKNLEAVHYETHKNLH